MKTYPYIEIAYTLKYRILNGSYQQGQQLPSIRLLAEQEKYNPATVHHAIKVLEAQGLISVHGTKGYYVIDDLEHITTLRKKEYMRLIVKLRCTLHSFGYSDKEIYRLIQNYK